MPGAPPAAVAAAQQNAQQGGSGSWTNGIVKGLAIYFGMQFLMSRLMPGLQGAQKTSPDQPASSGAAVRPVGINAIASWPLDAPLGLHVYLSTSPNAHIDFAHPELPHVFFDDFTPTETKIARSWETTFAVPETVQQNASLWADMYLTKNGASPDPSSPSYAVQNVHHTRKLLTRYMQLRRQRAVKNLFDAANETEEAVPAEDSKPIIGHWHRNLTIALVYEDANKRLKLPYSQLPPPVKEHVHLDGSASAFDATGEYRQYLPIVFPNDFWLMREHMYPINDTVSELSLRIDFTSISYFMFQVYATLDEAFNKQAASSGGGAELDEIKHMLTETNPILLATTIVVSILHTVFEFLAFKSDVGHWRGKKELVGVSVRTIITNVVVQLIILLYLLDQNENTSYMILAGQGIGLAIEAWKITKAVDIKLIPTKGIIPYRVEFKDKHVLTEDEKKTQEYDKLAFKWVTWGTTPFLIGYTIYSALYEKHRGAYSFVIGTLVSFIYMFGFVQLIPQLIINWKLKSVAHMPMKALTYKALNTVVDDFFSFVIRMPILHRLACFRDDVVFVILLYQMYIYKVDPKRANEYGQVLEDPQDVNGTTASAAKDKAGAIDAIESKKDR